MSNQDFNQIKQAALSQDPNALRAALRRPIYLGLSFPTRTHASIDLRKMGTVDRTAAAELALEGKHEAVEFLRLQGADVDIIATAYAMAGDHAQVERYQKTLGASINAIAEGYAQGGFEEKAWEFHDQGVDINFIAAGFAWGGHFEQAYRCVKEFGADANKVVFALALLGKHDQVKRFTDDFFIKNINPAQGYAVAGDVERAYQFSCLSFTDLATGFALGGHTEEVERCRKNGANVNLIAQAYALAGNVAMADHYLETFHADPTAIAIGFVIGNHDAQVLRYIRKHHVNPERLVGLSEKVFQAQTNNRLTTAYGQFSLNDQQVDQNSLKMYQLLDDQKVITSVSRFDSPYRNRR